MLTRRRREGSLSRQQDLLFCSSFVPLASVFFCAVSLAQIKNLQRRLNNLSIEASKELDKVCGNELWKSIGFDAFDSLDDSELRSRANYYYGQWQTARELQESIG